MIDRIGALIGLSKKAGKVKSGEFQTEREIKSGNAALVVIATDASDNTKKKFRNMCAFYQVPELTYATRDDLGRWIGCGERAMLSISDAGLAGKIRSMNAAIAAHGLDEGIRGMIDADTARTDKRDID